MAALIEYICKNCGNILYFTTQENKNCSCGNPDFVCLDINHKDFYYSSQSEKDKLIRDKLNLSEEQYEEIKKEWETIRARVNDEYYAQKLEKIREKNQNAPKCPTCGSKNVSKISTGKKAVGFGIFGVFSSNFGKTMQCKNCGYKW
jgi:hypothetical protein